MSRKLWVKEHDEENKYIVLEEENTLFALFRRYGKLLFLVLLLLLLIVFSLLGFYILKLDKSDITENNYEPLSISFEGLEDMTNLSGLPVTDAYAKGMFDRYYTGDFKKSGEVWALEVVDNKDYKIIFFSDGTSLRIMGDRVTRFAPLSNGGYAISKDNKLNKDARVREVTILNTENIFEGKVYHFSDGSSYIESRIGNVFVRNSKDINNNYISDNKVSYFDSKRDIDDISITYYSDGTTIIEKDGTKYLVRDKNDFIYENGKLSFSNDNSSNIIKSVTYDNGIIIDYYSDGGAIIKQGSNTISVRKSNSIVISGNKFIAVESSRYVDISKERVTSDGSKIIYLTNGDAMVDYPDGRVNLYVKENSNIKYSNNDIRTVGDNYEKETVNRTINGRVIREFESVTYIDPYDDKKIVVDKGNVLYDSDGDIKSLKDEETDKVKGGSLLINNNSSKELSYRVVLEEEEDRTTLDSKYIKYMFSANGVVSSDFLNKNVWKLGSELKDNKKIDKTTYIIYDGKIEAMSFVELNLILWTDYETIGNDMMSKAFIGTVKVYAEGGSLDE